MQLIVPDSMAVNPPKTLDLYEKQRGDTCLRSLLLFIVVVLLTAEYLEIQLEL